MKYTLPLSAVLAFSVVLQASASGMPSMVARWGFDEKNGITAIDAQGNGNDATLVNGAMRSDDIPGTGITNHTSLSLDGTSYATAPHIGFDNRSFTISAWLKTTDMTQNQTWFSQGDTTRDSRNLALTLTPKGAFEFSFQNDDLTTPDAIFTANTWHHAAFTFDAKTRQRRVYVDGVMQASGTASGVYLGTTGQTNIGRYDLQPFGSAFWHGNIDSVIIFDQALTGDDLAVLAMQTSSASSHSSRSSQSSRSSSIHSSTPSRANLSLTDRVLLRATLRRKLPMQSSSSSVRSLSSFSAASLWSASSSSSSSSMSSSSSIASVAVSAPANGPLYRVTSFQLHLRKDSRATAVNIRTLMPHDELIVLQMLKNGWAHVQTMDGVIGYVNASFIEKAE